MFQIVTSTCQVSSNIINSFVNNKRSALNIKKIIYFFAHDTFDSANEDLYNQHICARANKEK